MPNQNPSRLKRPLLYALVGSVILGAILGIIIVLRDTWDWYEVRVILSTIVIAVASLCGLACDLSRTPMGNNLLPKAGLALTGLGASLLIVGMWTEIDEEIYWKSAVSACILAIAFVHICLLSIATLIRKFQWVYWVACQVILGLAILLIVVIVGEVESEEMMRLIAVVAIVDAALTMVIPILHRIGRIDGRKADLLMPNDLRNVTAIDEEITRLRSQIQKLEKLKLEITGETDAKTTGNGVSGS